MARPQMARVEPMSRATQTWIPAAAIYAACRCSLGMGDCRLGMGDLRLDGGGYFHFMLFEAGLVGLDYGEG